MGLLSWLRGSDDAAQAASKGARRAKFDYSDEPFRKQLTADVGGRFVEQPSRTAGSIGNTIKGTAKYGAAGAVGTVGLWKGSEAVGDYTAAQRMESKEQNFEEYANAAEEIRNSNLTPEQKAEALDQLRKSYQNANSGPGGGNSGLSGILGDLGLLEKVILAFVIIAIVRAVARRAD